MARPRKLKNEEAAVIVREREGVKITSIGVTFGRKVNFGNYSAANLECSVWADVSGEPDENLPVVMADLWAMARRDVEAQPEMAAEPKRSPAAAPIPPKQPASQPQSTQEPRKPAETTVPPPQPPDASEGKSRDADVDVVKAGPGRVLTKRIVIFGQPKSTAGVDADAFNELLSLTPQIEKILGKGGALSELEALCPAAFVVVEGQRRYSRLALTQKEAEMLVKHFQTIVNGVKKGAADEGRI